MNFRIAPLALGTALGFTMNSVRADDPALLSLSMEHFRDSASVEDDPIGDTTTITTEKGFVSRKGILRSVSSDEYLKGVVDKKTGQKSLRVDASVSYYGRWRTYGTATYQSEGGPKSLPTIQVSRDIGSCAVGNCLYTEHVAFTVDEALLRPLAAGYVPGRPAVWHFKLIPKVGADYTGELSSAEIAGFLAKLDGSAGTVPAVPAKAAPSAPATARPSAASPPAPANTSSAPPKADLGIAGMAVAATVKQPNRTGVLVTGIVGNSVADKAGMIVGDIVYEFDGRPISTLTDLATAMAAGAAISAVAIKVHRGIADTTLTAQF